jgi:hypothetical protein
MRTGACALQPNRAELGQFQVSGDPGELLVEMSETRRRTVKANVYGAASDILTRTLVAERS